MNTKRFVYGGLAGAAYAALTMLLAPISYGPVQFRVSEALCVLPFFDPVYALGLFAGCVVSNLISAAGLLDVVFGSLATLLAGLCTAWFGRSRRGWGAKLGACAMPVVFNGVIVGAVLAIAIAPEGSVFWASFALYGAQVAGGEAVVMYALGLPLLQLLSRKKFFSPG